MTGARRIGAAQPRADPADRDRRHRGGHRRGLAARGEEAAPGLPGRCPRRAGRAERQPDRPDPVLRVPGERRESARACRAPGGVPPPSPRHRAAVCRRRPARDHLSLRAGARRRRRRCLAVAGGRPCRDRCGGHPPAEGGRRPLCERRNGGLPVAPGRARGGQDRRRGRPAQDRGRWNSARDRVGLRDAGGPSRTSARLRPGTGSWTRSRASPSKSRSRPASSA